MGRLEETDAELMELPVTPILGPSDDSHQGKLRCSTADLFTVEAGSAVQLGVANPSNRATVRFAFFNNNSNSVVWAGVLGPRGSGSHTVPFNGDMNIYRVQNQSPCGRTGITPILLWSAVTDD